MAPAAKSKTLTFPEEWDIAEVGPRQAQALLKAAFLSREPVILMGPTGAGKTAVVRQTAKALARDCEAGKLSIVPEDGEEWDPSKWTDDPEIEEYYSRVHRRWQEEKMTSAKTSFEHTVLEPSALDAFDIAGLPGVDKETERQFYYRPRFIPDKDDVLGIWQITEMNRPAGARTLKPLQNAFERRVVGQHPLPPGISLVADVNEGVEYEVVDMKNPFLIKRCTWIWLSNTLEEWLLWMEENYRSELVRMFILEKGADYLDDNARRRACKPYACPAVWTKIQRNLDVWFHAGLTILDVEPLIAGKIGLGKAGEFVQFVQKGLEFSPSKILLDYAAVKAFVRKAVTDGEGADRLALAALQTIRFLLRQEHNHPSLDTMIRNFTEFFLDLPMDTSQNVAMELASVKMSSGETQHQVNPQTRMHLTNYLMGHPGTHERLLKLHSVSNVTRRSQTGGGILGLASASQGRSV